MATAALRSMIAELDNAEAVPVAEVEGLADVGPHVSTSRHVAGGVVGLGGAEAERRVLTLDEQHRVVDAEVAARTTAAEEYERRGHVEAAERLRREAQIISAAVS